MKDAEIAERLRDRNPWWRRPRGWQEEDQNLREAAEAPFKYRPGVLDDLRPGGLYTLSGPRRVGKSLEVRRAIESLIDGGVPPRNILYNSCDGFSLQDLRRLFHTGESLTRGVQAWELYLRCGGFPRAIGDFLQTGDVTSGFVQDLWDVIRGDAIRATSLGDADLLNLLARIANGISSPLNASAIGRDVGLGSHHSVNDRINDLAFAFQTWRCHQEDRHGRPSTGAQRKVYFVDPLIARLPSQRHAAYPAPDVTKLSEQQIGLALARAAADGRADRFVAGEAVMYERTRTGSEIDFVGARQVPIESKYVERNWKSQARTVAAAHGRGILATRNVLDTDGDVWAVPACVLAWMLGS